MAIARFRFGYLFGLPESIKSFQPRAAVAHEGGISTAHAPRQIKVLIALAAVENTDPSVQPQEMMETPAPIRKFANTPLILITPVFALAIARRKPTLAFGEGRGEVTCAHPEISKHSSYFNYTWICTGDSQT